MRLQKEPKQRKTNTGEMLMTRLKRLPLALFLLSGIFTSCSLLERSPANLDQAEAQENGNEKISAGGKLKDQKLKPADIIPVKRRDTADFR